MKKVAFGRSTDTKTVDELEVDGLKQGQCERVTNSGPALLLPGIYPPGDCRLHPDSPRSVEQIQCNSQPSADGDVFLRMCACTEPVTTSTATATTTTTVTTTTNTILKALHQRLADLESTIETGGSSTEALEANIKAVNEALGKKTFPCH